MNLICRVLTILMIPLGLVAEEEKPKVVTEMPPGVHVSKGKDGNFRYEIRGIYTELLPKSQILEGNNANEKFERLLSGSLMADSEVVDLVSLDVDVKKKMFAVVSPKKLSSEELTGLLRFAAGRGVMPSWHELVARESTRSKEYREDLFAVKVVDLAVPEDVKWSEPRRFKPLKLPLQMGKDRLGHIELTPTARYCMCHSHFTMRIFDQRGEVVWKGADDLLKGIVQVSLIDSDGDGWQEVLAEGDNHGEKKVISITYQGKK